MTRSPNLRPQILKRNTSSEEPGCGPGVVKNRLEEKTLQGNTKIRPHLNRSVHTVEGINSKVRITNINPCSIDPAAAAILWRVLKRDRRRLTHLVNKG